MIKEYFDPNQTMQGYLYSSVKENARKNLAVKHHAAKSLIDCTGFIHGRFIEFGDKGKKVTMIIVGRCSQKITPNGKIDCEDVFWPGLSFHMEEADKLSGGFILDV